MRTGPSFSCRQLICSRNADKTSELQFSLASWVIALGALTENRNSAGTDLAHLSQVSFLCGR